MIILIYILNVYTPCFNPIKIFTKIYHFYILSFLSGQPFDHHLTCYIGINYLSIICPWKISIQLFD